MSKVDGVIKELSFNLMVNYFNNNDKIILVLLCNLLHNQINLRAKLYIFYTYSIYYILLKFPINTFTAYLIVKLRGKL